MQQARTFTKTQHTFEQKVQEKNKNVQYTVQLCAGEMSPQTKVLDDGHIQTSSVKRSF